MSNVDFHLVAYKNPLVHGAIHFPIKARLRIDKNHVILAQMLDANTFYFSDGTNCTSHDDAAKYAAQLANACPKRTLKACWAILIEIENEDYWINIKDLNANVFEKNMHTTPCISHFRYHDSRTSINVNDFINDNPTYFRLFANKYHPDPEEHDDGDDKEAEDTPSKRQKLSKYSHVYEDEDEDEDDCAPEFWDIFNSKDTDWTQEKIIGLILSQPNDLPRLASVNNIYAQQFGNTKFECIFVHPRTNNPVTVWMNSPLMWNVPSYSSYLQTALIQFG